VPRHGSAHSRVVKTETAGAGGARPGHTGYPDPESLQEPQYISRYSDGLLTVRPGVLFPAGSDTAQRRSRVWGPYSLWVKWPGREAGHSSPASAEGKKFRTIHPLHQTYSWRGA
jgi:hypothetical protein